MNKNLSHVLEVKTQEGGVNIQTIEALFDEYKRTIDINSWFERKFKNISVLNSCNTYKVKKGIDGKFSYLNRYEYNYAVERDEKDCLIDMCTEAANVKSIEEKEKLLFEFFKTHYINFLSELAFIDLQSRRRTCYDIVLNSENYNKKEAFNTCMQESLRKLKNTKSEKARDKYIGEIKMYQQLLKNIDEKIIQEINEKLEDLSDRRVLISDYFYEKNAKEIFSKMGEEGYTIYRNRKSYTILPLDDLRRNGYQFNNIYEVEYKFIEMFKNYDRSFYLEIEKVS